MCYEMLQLLEPWRKEKIPVIGWKEFCKRVQLKFRLMDDEALKKVISYLHLMGEVCITFL